MSVMLSVSYDNFPAGTVATFDALTESSLIAQGLATPTNLSPTAGTQASSLSRGTAVIAQGTKALIVNTPSCTPQSCPIATIAQATPDTTLTNLISCVPGNGFFTVQGNANSTGTVVVNWIVFNTSGLAN